MAAISATLACEPKTVRVPAGSAPGEKPDAPDPKTELQRYYDEETSIKQQEIQARTDYESDKLRCQGSKGTAAMACLKQAGKNLERALAKVAIRRNNNNVQITTPSTSRPPKTSAT